MYPPSAHRVLQPAYAQVGVHFFQHRLWTGTQEAIDMHDHAHLLRPVVEDRRVEDTRQLSQLLHLHAHFVGPDLRSVPGALYNFSQAFHLVALLRRRALLRGLDVLPSSHAAVDEGAPDVQDHNAHRPVASSGRVKEELGYDKRWCAKEQLMPPLPIGQLVDDQPAWILRCAPIYPHPFDLYHLSLGILIRFFPSHALAHSQFSKSLQLSHFPNLDDFETKALQVLLRVVVLLRKGPSDFHVGRFTHIINLTDRPVGVILNHVERYAGLLTLLRPRFGALATDRNVVPHRHPYPDEASERVALHLSCRSSPQNHGSCPPPPNAPLPPRKSHTGSPGTDMIKARNGRKVDASGTPQVPLVLCALRALCMFCGRSGRARPRRRPRWHPALLGLGEDRRDHRQSSHEDLRILGLALATRARRGRAKPPKPQALARRAASPPAQRRPAKDAAREARQDLKMSCKCSQREPFSVALRRGLCGPRRAAASH